VDFEELMWLCNFCNSKLNNVPDMPGLQKIIEDTDYGFFAIRCEISKGIVEHMVGQKMAHSLVMLADKDVIEGMKIKYNKDFVKANVKL
jgi:hypothetical protein